MELKVSNTNKTFIGSDGEPDFVLAIPDLAFELGKIVFIMGRNGSGKSVFLRLVTGDILPDSASVTLSLDGKSWIAQERMIGIVRQQSEDNLALDLTVRENWIIRDQNNLLVEKLFPHLSNHNSLTRLKQYPRLFQKLDQPCKNLSTGQQQTLSFIVATARNNSLLALDEFLSATDQETRSILREMTKDYVRNMTACVLIVSHDIRTALEDADRILIIKEGKLFLDIGRNSKNWNENDLASLLV